MSGRFRTSNPIMDGIEAFGAVDNIFRRRRQDERQTALDARNAAWEDEQRGAWRDDRGRADEARKTKAEIYRLEQEFYSQVGRYTTEYFDPEKRAQHKELLSEGMARLDSGKIDDNFFIQYANSIYRSQINRGTGGSKSIAKFKPGPDGKSIVVGLNVTDNSGRSRMEMMTKNRGTREEGDNEVKTVPISGLVQDNIKRQILIDTFDEHGVGVGPPEEQRQKIEQALTEAKARLLELGDTSIAERDQGLATEARNYQRQLALSDHQFALGSAKDAMGHRRALQLEGMRHRNAVALKGMESQGGYGAPPIDKKLVEIAYRDYLELEKNYNSAKAGGVIETTNEYGEPITRKATYQDIRVIEEALKDKHRFLVQAGVFGAPQQPSPAPQQPTGAVTVSQQPRQNKPSPIPEGTALGRPATAKNGKTYYPIIDVKTNKPWINPQTGKVGVYIP